MDNLSLDKIAWSILDTKSIGVVLVNSSGVIQLANDTIAMDWGISPADLPGKSIWNFYPTSIKNHHRILFNQVLETAQPITTQYKEQGHWKQVLIQPVQENGENTDFLAICISDISRQVDAEEQIKQILLELTTAQEDERYRISQDLHDDVGQKMTVLLFEMRTLREKVEKKQAISLQEMDSLIRSTGVVLKHVRQILYQLHPPSLSKTPLPNVLAAFCSTFEESNNLHIDFSFQKEFPDLPDKVATAIYRFVQEGLTNVVKHAKASSVWINLDYEDGDLAISLEDNGQGFDLNNHHEGFGLHGIKERFLMLGGSLDIESAPGNGTRLSGTVPLVQQ